MKRVLFLSYFFPPTGGAPAQRALKFSKFLPEHGYVPIILTGPGISHNEWTPLDTSLEREIDPAVNIYRVQGPIPKSGGAVAGRINRLVGCPTLFAKWWIQSAIALAEKIMSVERVDLIYASMSPFESAEIGEYLSRKFGVPWVADLRDPWAIDEIQVYPSIVHKKLALRKMKKLLLGAAVVIMNTPEATVLLKKTFPEFNKKRITTITNGFDPEDMAGHSAVKATNQKFTIVHTGSFLTDYGMLLRRRRWLYDGLGGATPGVDIATRSHLYLFEAVHQWCERNASVKDNLEIVFAGSSAPPSEPVVGDIDIIKLTRFLRYLPRNEAIGIVRSADLLFLAMHNMPVGCRATSAPSKVFEYMASGRPILAAVPDSDAKDWLAKAGTGLFCRPDDVDGMVQVLAKSYSRWKAGEELPTPDREFLKAFERRTLTRSLAREFDIALGVNRQ